MFQISLIGDPRSLWSWRIKATDESLSKVDSLVPLMHHYELLRSPHFLLPYNSFNSRLLNFSFPTTSSTTFPLLFLHHHRHHYTTTFYILVIKKKMRFVVERASLPSPSIICTIFVRRIGEPELEQFVFLNGKWKRQKMNLYNYVTTQWS